MIGEQFFERYGTKSTYINPYVDDVASASPMLMNVSTQKIVILGRWPGLEYRPILTSIFLSRPDRNVVQPQLHPV